MKKSLIETNPYLKDPALRKALFKQSVASSTAIEGVLTKYPKLSKTSKKKLRAIYKRTSCKCGHRAELEKVKKAHAEAIEEWMKWEGEAKQLAMVVNLLNQKLDLMAQDMGKRFVVKDGKVSLEFHSCGTCKHEDKGCRIDNGHIACEGWEG